MDGTFRSIAKNTPSVWLASKMRIEELLVPVLFTIAGIIVLYAEDEIHFDRLKTYPDKTHVRERLAKIGRENEYESFRIKQLIKSIIVFFLTFLFLLVLLRSLLPTLLLALMSSVAAYFYVDQQLTKDVRKYRAAIESQFPAIIEMLTLALSAGETPVSAMTRIAQRSHGSLANELKTVINSVRSGAPFHVALDALGRRVESVVIRRFVDALITAMLRGAPLIDVLQRHAAEARQIQRNHLMDKAGKAEISMMIPVVFLILPVSILFALWPSLTHLNIFAA